MARSDGTLDLTTEEKHRAAKFNEDRKALMGKAQAGDVGALILVWELYRVRLPLVEARMRVTLPWMRAAEV